MTAEELVELHVVVGAQRDQLSERMQNFAAASIEAPSEDEDADIALEALFLRAFTHYEEVLERLFLHYITGGSSMSGVAGTSFLSVTDESRARRIIGASNRFLSWSKPADVKVMAGNYLNQGWPFVDMLGISNDTLSDCTKVRNRIAHRSDEARRQFAAVQRNLFQTERLFDMSPGQMLRCRFRGTRELVFQHYSKTLAATLQSIADPPA